MSQEPVKWAIYAALVVVGLFVVFGTVISASDRNISAPKKQKTTRVFNEPALQLPANGSARYFYQGKFLPTLTVVTKASAGHNFLKVEEWNSKRLVATIFIRDGMSATINLPPGTYRIKVACGNTWYGEWALFGPSTACSVADKEFSFAEEETGSDVVFTQETIWLTERPGGNLRTSQIDIDDF